MAMRFERPGLPLSTADTLDNPGGSSSDAACFTKADLRLFREAMVLLRASLMPARKMPGQLYPLLTTQPTDVAEEDLDRVLALISVPIGSDVAMSWNENYMNGNTLQPRYSRIINSTEFVWGHIYKGPISLTAITTATTVSVAILRGDDALVREMVSQFFGV